MCQLAAYIGDKNVVPGLLTALKNQEVFFGAHATGIGFLVDGEIHFEKSVGHVDVFREKTDIDSRISNIAIAHSRVGNWVDGKWDEKSNITKMAHPFLDCKNELCLIHNGVITNKKELWTKLKSNHNFTSYDSELDTITDSEVAVHLLEDELSKGKTMDEGIKAIVKHLEGSFLFAILKKDVSDTIWLVNWHQPCVVAIGADEAFFCTSKRGYDNVIDPQKYTIFEPPKNSLIKLRRGQIDVELLDLDRAVPDLKLNQCQLGEEIVKVLEKEGEVNFRDLWYMIFPEKVAQSFSVPSGELKKMKQNGVSIVNPYIHTLDMLVKEGKIKQRIIRNKEAGVENTPRFSYRMA